MELLDLAREYAALIDRKAHLEDDLSDCKSEIADQHDTLLNKMVEEGIKTLPIKVGDQTYSIFIHRQLWAKPKLGDRQAVVHTLKRCGLADLVNEGYNTNTLSGYVRERLASGRELQPTLERVLDLTEVFSVRGRRSSASSTSQTAKAMQTLRNDTNG